MTSRLGDTEYKYTFTQLVMPLIREFAPDFILVSAGFDAADGDPLGKHRLFCKHPLSLMFTHT